MQKRNLAGLVSGLTAASIWGGMYVVSKATLEVVPPFTLLSIRLLLGMLTLGVVVAARRQARLSRAQIWASFWVGAIGYGISLGFQFVGTKLSTAANGALLTAATPAFVSIFAPYLLGETLTPRRVAALSLSTLGVLAVIDPGASSLSPSLFWGNLALLAAALTWAIYSVLVRKVTQASDLFALSMVMLAGGIPTSILGSLVELRTQEIGTITPGIIGGILFLGIVSTAIGMALWNYAFATLPASTAALTFFAQPVVGACLGWAFLGEDISQLFLLGGALIGAGLFIASTEQ